MFKVPIVEIARLVNAVILVMFVSALVRLGMKDVCWWNV